MQLLQAAKEPGQVIVEIERQRVRGARDFDRVYGDVDPGETFLLRVLQPDGQSTMVTALNKPR